MADAPPHDPRAEAAILGALLHNPAVFADLKGLRADHFFLPQNVLLFSLLQDMHIAGEDIDSVTVFAKLRERGELRKVGAPHLSDLLQAFKSAGNVGTYAQIVVDQWKLRKINELGERFKSIRSATDDIPAALEAARRFLDEVDVEDDRGDDFDAAYDLFVEWYESESVAIPSPWGGLNRILAGGWHRQRLHLCAGRPGVGKSVLALNAVLGAAKQGFKSVTYSLEMGKAECLARILAAGANVPLKQLFEHRLGAPEHERIDGFRAQPYLGNIAIDDRPSQSIESIMADCRSRKRNGLDLVVIDHSLLLEPSDRRHSLHQQVNHVTKQAKLLARRCDVALLVMHQMNRAKDGDRRKPLMSDLREGGEADADFILVLDPDPQNHQVIGHPLKSRFGPTNHSTSFVDELAYARLG